MPAPAESEVEPSLLLNVLQSPVVRRPRLAEDAEGRLKVICWPLPVIAKSLPAVEVAKVTAPLDVVAKPVPIAVMVPVFCERHVPLYAKQPVNKFKPLADVVVAPRSVS